MSYIVTYKTGHVMSLDTNEKFKIIENEAKECFPFEDKLLVCYKQGTKKECQEFIDNQNEKIQECLELKNINDD